MNANLDIIVISAFVSSTISMVFWLVQRYFSNKGEVKLYAKFVYAHYDPPKLWGFEKDDKSKLYFSVPIWIDIINTYGINKVIRDLSINLKLNEHTIATMIQINKYTIQKNGETKTEYLGDKGSYTFVIPAKSAFRADLEYFLLKESNIECSFNKITMSYYDEKDIRHEFFLADIPLEKCWTIGELESPTKNKWLRLK